MTWKVKLGCVLSAAMLSHVALSIGGHIELKKITMPANPEHVSDMEFEIKGEKNRTVVLHDDDGAATLAVLHRVLTDEMFFDHENWEMVQKDKVVHWEVVKDWYLKGFVREFESAKVQAVEYSNASPKTAEHYRGKLEKLTALSGKPWISGGETPTYEQINEMGSFLNHDMKAHNYYVTEAGEEKLLDLDKDSYNFNVGVLFKDRSFAIPGWKSRSYTRLSFDITNLQ